MNLSPYGWSLPNQHQLLQKFPENFRLEQTLERFLIFSIRKEYTSSGRVSITCPLDSFIQIGKIQIHLKIGLF